MVLGLVAAVVMSRGSVAKALAMIVIGLLLGLIGTDIHTGLQRYTFGVPSCSTASTSCRRGRHLRPRQHHRQPGGARGQQTSRCSRRRSSACCRRATTSGCAWPASRRGTVLGCLLGVLPGGGAVLSSFAAYSLERKLAKDPSRFGKGAVEGVAGPESANNAGAQTSSSRCSRSAFRPTP